MKVHLCILLILTFKCASAGEVTIYQPSGFGKPTIFVDGRPVGKLGYNKRIKISLADGRHFLSGTHLDTSSVLNVTGDHILRFGPAGLIEVCPDDLRVKDELKSTNELIN